MQFRIPKQTDRNLIIALAAIRDELKPLRQFIIEVLVFEPGGTPAQLPDENPDQAPAIQFVVAEESQIMPWLRLKDKATNHAPLQVQRNREKITDHVTVAEDPNWINQIPENQRGPISVKLASLARKFLKATDAEASLSGGSESEWTRYRDAQQIILNSLQETQKTILTEFNRKSLEIEAAAQKRMQDRETELKKQYESLEGKLTQEYSERTTELANREAGIKSREESFNTKEARYVARKEQQNQIAQIQGWLEDWSLTKGTRSKRYTVAAAYLLSIVGTGALTIWLSEQSIEIFKVAATDFSKIEWWQWVFLSFRSILPLAAFITFIIYFIRWSAAWARQHAEEEFRNRARILDIGRTAWLLEAVRDAQDNQKELPPELLKELSRNLFAYAAPIDTTDLHPQTITDLIMQGLSSLRLKTPDGTEVEAKRK